MPSASNNYAANGGGNAGRAGRGQEDDFRYEIVDSYGVLSTSPSGWSKELNRVSWNGKDAKFDIREWSPNHGKMRKGVTFTGEEAIELRELLDAAIESMSGDAYMDSTNA